jgi:phosphoenolpyruvate carboxylase
LISNAATAFSTSLEPVMTRYAELAESVPQAGAIFERIREEHARTREGLEIIYGGPLATTRPHIHELLRRRSEALEPLHAHQIQLLRTWRGMDPGDGERLLPSLLRTINAIASGLGATG